MYSGNGVSVILCCYNSVKRLNKTLKALANQKFDEAINVEIIVVDNASTDHTAEYANSIWESLNTATKLRNVHQPIPGLGNARKTGISAATYPYVLFCDDDNWLSPNYINDGFHILNNNLSVGACGGIGIPIFEIDKPFWFDEYAESFAVGSQQIVKVKGKQLSLYGAGLMLKKDIIYQLENCGYSQFLKDRTGTKLSSSGDTELTNAIVLLGYELRYSENLKFFHYLSKERLTLNYLERLFIAFGTDGPIRNLYHAHLCSGLINKLIKNWYFHFMLSVFRFIKYYVFPPKKYGRKIYLSWNKAYLKELFNIKPSYKTIIYNIRKVVSVDTRNKKSDSVQLAVVA